MQCREYQLIVGNIMNSGKQIKISVIIPIYNEARRLSSAVTQIWMVVQQLGIDFEIFISEDGSTDGSDNIAKGLARDYSFVYALHSRKRLGRGAALKKALKRSTGDIILYSDVDLSTDLVHLHDFVNAIIDGADIVVGSRLIEGSHVEQMLLRTIISKIYNRLVWLLFRSPIHDHQCGFKAFKKPSIIKLVDAVEDNHWFWDTEMIIRALRCGFTVIEYPVTWKYQRTSKVHLITDIRNMGLKLLRLRVKLARA
jgi:glycosyltransferase involved in cell wall biosynthesis